MTKDDLKYDFKFWIGAIKGSLRNRTRFIMEEGGARYTELRTEYVEGILEFLEEIQKRPPE